MIIKKILCSGAAALAITAGVLPFEAAAEEEKVQKITFVQDDDQTEMTTVIYTLKNSKAADLLPFVKSAVLRYNPDSTVNSLDDHANKRQLLIVNTGSDMVPYINEMVKVLDRPAAKMNNGNISGSGIAYGSYLPKFRAGKDMRKVIVGGQVASSTEDSRVRFDRKSNMFYFKDTPSRVADIKRKLEWLDKPVPQSRIEFKIYEVRDSDLKDIGIDYLSWKNGPGLNLFAAGYEALSMRTAETLFNAVSKGIDLVGNVSYGFGGFYTAPAFDLSFIRILQQNGKALINSSASLLVSNAPATEFKVKFSPEYQNIVKDDDHISSVEIGGNADLELAVSDAVITGGKNGVINFAYALNGANTVERNNQGVEIAENTSVNSFATLNGKEEKIIASWEKTSMVEQTIGIPFLCELPVLKYIFGTTTSNAEKTRYFVTARALQVDYNEDMPQGALNEFDEILKK